MINFPIFLKYKSGLVKKYESYDDIEKKVEFFPIEKENCEVFDSEGQKLILNVFLDEIQDLYPEK